MERSETKKREIEGRANIIPPWSTTIQNTPKEIAIKGTRGLFIRTVFNQEFSHKGTFYLKVVVKQFTIILVYQIIVTQWVKILELKAKRAGVTQWLEYLPSKQKVAGSNPVSRSKPAKDIFTQSIFISGYI